MLEKFEKLNIETSKLRSDGTYGMFVLELGIMYEFIYRNQMEN